MRKILLLILIFALTGCAYQQHQPKVSINAIAGPESLSFSTYAISPTSESGHGLVFDQYAGQIERVLSDRGFVRIDDMPKADVGIFLETKVGQAQTSSYTAAIPNWGQTGYSGSQTYGSFVGNQYYSNTTRTPTYGVTGYTPYTVTSTSYPVGFSLGAWVRSGDDRIIKQIWSVTVTSSSINGDLRALFPAMLNAASPYIGLDTGGIISVPMPGM